MYDPATAQRRQWQVRLDWGWGRLQRFQEHYTFHVNALDDIDAEIRAFIPKMVERYAFDCGRLDYPLNPWLYGIVITPVGHSEYRTTNEWDALVEQAVEKKREALCATK
jgi:hypothetical protein